MLYDHGWIALDGVEILFLKIVAGFRGNKHFARANHLRVVPLCPYVSNFLRKDSEYHALLSADDLRKILSAESA